MDDDEQEGCAQHARVEALAQLGAETRALLLAHGQLFAAQGAVLARVEARLEDVLEVLASRLGVGRAELAKAAAVRALRQAAGQTDTGRRPA